MDAARPTIVPTLPRSLYLETTNRCDSACQTCIRTFMRLEPPKDLTLAELKQIVEQFPVLERVILHGIGEPLLNRELFAMVAYLKAKGAVVLFNSNAISLTPQHALQLIGSGLDEYRVSMDAATRGAYQRIRGVDQFDRVVKNVRGLINLQRRLKQKRPRVSLWFTAMNANIEELPAFVRLAHELGVPEVHVQRLVFYGQGLAVEAQSLHGALHQRQEELIGEAERLAAMLEIAFTASGASTPLASLRGTPHEALPHHWNEKASSPPILTFPPGTLWVRGRDTSRDLLPPRRGRIQVGGIFEGNDQATRPWAGCQRPWTISYITANGSVLPCCISPWTAQDYRGLILGNAFTDEFVTIWNGRRYQAFREAFDTDAPPDPCRGCGLLWSV
ncbi:MAG: SPASM domain-containing protein [Candidatus Methylomirabilis oxyfera]|nr:SPASM domain-containing protein [Candidatus Methylomirabilis oxyfera]